MLKRSAKTVQPIHFLVEGLGWLGVTVIFTAYLLVTNTLIDPQDLSYQLMNLGGAICIGVESYTKRNFEPVVLNILWAGVAVFAIINFSR